MRFFGILYSLYTYLYYFMVSQIQTVILRTFIDINVMLSSKQYLYEGDDSSMLTLRPLYTGR